jgi:hypothetical protein
VDRNEDSGPIAAHLYDLPGTYDPVLKVRDPDGDTDTYTTTVTVIDPNTEFGDSRTWCFANSAGTFQGCPLDDDADGTCEAGESSYSTQCVVKSDFDDALLNNTASSGCNADGASGSALPRCLFREGDTFDMGTAVNLAAGTSSVGLIRSFGTGTIDNANVNITGGGGSGAVSLDSFWHLSGFDFDCGTVDCFLFTAPAVINGVGATNAGVSNVTATGDISAAMSNGGAQTEHEDWWLVNSTFTKTGTTSSGTHFIFPTGPRWVIQGNSVDGNSNALLEYIIRAYIRDSIIKHNYLADAGPSPGSSTRSVVQYRSSGDMDDGCNSGGARPYLPTTNNVFSWNELANENAIAGNGDHLKICQTQGGCTAVCDSEGEGECSDMLVENNFFHLDGSPGTVTHPITVQCADTTVRNNIIDYQGAAAAGTVNMVQLMALVDTANGATPYPDDNVHVFNNTFYTDDMTTNILRPCNGDIGGGTHLCYSNLMYVPGHTGTRGSSATGWTYSNNVFIDGSPGGNPFVGAVPGLDATTPADFELAAAVSACDTDTDGDEAEDCGTIDWTAVTDSQMIVDWGLGCRPEDGADGDATEEWDLGAWERGSGACP